MNGSRVNPNAPRDFFQDYDVVYFVTDLASFTQDHSWIARFGEMMIMQLPDEMADPPPGDGSGFAYLMQFADGNRIDLGLLPVDRLDALGEDSLSVLLLDKDGIIKPSRPRAKPAIYRTAHRQAVSRLLQRVLVGVSLCGKRAVATGDPLCEAHSR